MDFHGNVNNVCGYALGRRKYILHYNTEYLFHPLNSVSGVYIEILD